MVVSATQSRVQVWRPEASVSVLDSGFMLGDGVWEGLRLHEGVLLFVEEHLARLYEGAKALDMHIDLDPQRLQQLVYSVCDANGMADASGESVCPEGTMHVYLSANLISSRWGE